ncbi:MAG: hypothetical protein J2P22_19325 [Nocardioides sp.]|nr:hypothetical protein [Nocardioides sp.]
MTSLLRRNRWVSRALLVVVAVLVLVAFARIEHTTPLLLPMVLLVGAVIAIAGLVVDSGGTPPALWRIDSEYGGTTAGQDSGLAGNARLLENHLSARRADPLLQRRLAGMTDDRLARMGMRRGDPGVDALLGPTLTAVLDGPPRTLQLEEIEECIRRIEELSP